jgi:hypothetical protein
VGNISEICVPGTIVIFLIETGERGINIFKGYIMFIAPYAGAKMNIASLVEVEIHDWGTAHVAIMRSFKFFFAVHALQAGHFALYKFYTALLVEAAIR